MTRAQEIRHEVLLQLYGSGSIPISIEHIRRVCKRAGFDYSETELRDALHFHKGQGFAEQLTDSGTGEVRYRITSAGILQYENHG